MENLSQAEIKLAIQQKAIALGFSKVGIARAESGLETERLQEWLALGYQADMDWMTNPKRQDITQVMEGGKSVICVALNYYTPHQHSADRNVGKISRYGWGRDYHKVLTKKLKALATWLNTQGENIQTRYYVDTGPIAEKAFAQRAGIGWIGKHSNVITRDYGSWLFLGEVLTNLELEPDTPHTDHCGTCTRCLDACPTGAIAQPFVVDANRCIAFHTIENKAEQIPDAIAANLQNWVAGCDICQDVCPWNQRFAQETTESDFQPFPHNVDPQLDTLANMTEQEWDQNFTGSALRRIKRDRWQRNAKTVSDNLQ
ncbi:tRNA epoxyqueuosine(34) reductase QueG [Pseudanabaena sp. UWO311]|uniref:tRNA epoxyqueuosine(34) reductase QueG n=1 Tax=Pseudanabaena sp. UWO311 TaxID=2487337 RepID=UPI001157471C|nr:tRNA epoxyqueuosine(34) reductase QueG [Pseudanabaena sp. UWO311]TYQ25793.1 tRNA epoxyqueuosine(34) reductase QueG [Pseudanabaena sp. UWO311]